MDPTAIEALNTADDKAEPATSTTNGAGAGTETDNKFQQAIAAWRNIDLTTLIPQLDTAASDLVAHQRDSLVSRKELAQKTKEFRKLDDATKALEVKTLLKSYQTYIDLITKQTQATHSAFLQVYSPLSEAPDPYPLLDASIDSLVTAEETLPKVVEENQQLQRSVNRLTAQLEETEKRLEAERTTRQAIEAGRDEKIKSVETSWTAVLNEKQDNWTAKEQALEEKVENQERLLKEVKANLEVSHRMSRGEVEANDLPRGATTAELEIVTSELDRANQRLAQIEARNEQLRLELAQAASGQGQSKAAIAVEDDPTFLRLQSENSSLLRRLESSRLEKDAERRKLAGDMRGLEKDVANLRGDNAQLKGKLSLWSDYDNVKKELEVLKSIEFSTGLDEENDTSLENDDPTLPSIESPHSTQKKPESLEHLLLTRNKKLTNELTLLRVSHKDLQSRLETLQSNLLSTTTELEKSRSLSATLESDLEKIQQEATNAFGGGAMSVAGTYTSRYPHSSLRRGRATSPTSSIISGFDPRGTQSPLGDDSSSSSGFPLGAGSGILPMITAQRDRFKLKIQDLETQLQKEASTISSLRSEVASLQRDNLNLYEKTRYANAHNRSGGGYVGNPTGSVAINISNDSSTSSGMGMSSSSTQYRPSSSIFSNPFTTRESARMFRQMSRLERVVYRGAKLVLATRTSRNLFAAYCVALHLVVLLSLYWLSGAATSSIYHAGPLGAAAVVAEGGHVEGSGVLERGVGGDGG